LIPVSTHAFYFEMCEHTLLSDSFKKFVSALFGTENESKLVTSLAPCPVVYLGLECKARFNLDEVSLTVYAD
jgi:hypothetical protein